ncbi:putative RING-H2 finger protein ATL53 [Durio zibethinus]|uniref:RING-type E3 ubiquitin transferase n=1 Tax=Durio zibethinus TaxID=66656 RepID=A0A6P5YCP0_DURZI|nr:putative RING-H2 finger protein ATL53 [Durio zibethinus]XP_022738290.1 putative RING-H2 finger protein ATL53 [Durio zibethinus]XP_022738291.1 putative RING-H2 finger protein ATL53 [Durio zibethinus]
MDSRVWYCFETWEGGGKYFLEIWEGELVDDQIPDDYEGEFIDDNCYKGQFRCCRGLIDRQEPDSIKLAALFEQKLLHQSSSYTPCGQEVPELVMVEIKCNIVNFTEALLRDERNMNRRKFLIVAKFGAFMTTRYNDDDGELEEEKEEENIVGTLVITRYNDSVDDDDDDDDIEFEEEDEDMDGDISTEVNDQIGFVPASEASIEALQNVSGLDNNSECVICLGRIKGEELAKSVPCGHVYHGDCIVQWLETSQLCPLCRYAMPIDESH